MDLRRWTGDITSLTVDAVVNAANTGLRRGSGVCGAIFGAAGPQLDGACAALGGCAIGDAVATPGFDLPAPWIIHTVGPIWHGGAQGEPELLASCYRRVLEVAEQIGARSVAIPAISTGVYGYPAAAAADLAVRTLRHAASTTIDHVVLVAFDDHTARLYEQALTREI